MKVHEPPSMNPSRNAWHHLKNFLEEDGLAEFSESRFVVHVLSTQNNVSQESTLLVQKENNHKKSGLLKVEQCGSFWSNMPNILLVGWRP